ncbi:hypothetical protein [Veronia pacifica]|uniref:N-acetyltransferase domain-containing protein n=1 Tax=Veronia pacifica TaxID=1080227 RepID=A0A1C3ESP6_9GAMM|nr:hypothetical protein [Veronia pacifica]ODA36256.1 hypothetical protein A8L45_01255 [Veronia pacifica]
MRSLRFILGIIRVSHNIDDVSFLQRLGTSAMDIAPSHRGKGNGKWILELLLQKVTALGIEHVLVTADRRQCSLKETY